MELNKYIDHTNLKQDMSEQDLIKLVNEAKEYDFFSICINPCWVKQASELLAGSNTNVCSVIGFPLGANTTSIKVLEAKEAIENGASEIDMVINVSKLKDKDYEYVYNEIKKIKEAIGDNVLKVIIEACLLKNEEKTIACQIIMKAGADFVKTSTGMSTGGATVGDVKLFKEVVGDTTLIKAAGGVRTYEDAISMIEAGANRIGTSGGVKIVNGETHTDGY
mgnify:FL=1